MHPWFGIVNRLVALTYWSGSVDDLCHRNGYRVRKASDFLRALMSDIRAEILPTEVANTSAARILINAPASVIFDLLANPASHQLFDGSGTIQKSLSAPERLFLGAQFSMAMKIKVPYRIKNTVVAFEENKRITWSHLMKWTWCYELSELGNGSTQVTESFDASAIPWYAKWWLKKTGAMAHNPKWIAKSLVRLKLICEA